MALKKKQAAEVVQESPETQLQAFDRAAKLFRAGNFSEARQVFEIAAAGSTRAISHNARLHITMCDRRLTKPDVHLVTAQDFYNAGLERLNFRDAEGARPFLERALQLARNENDLTAEICYAIAACCALTRDARGAYENLKRAIELEPKNRAAARQDPDFAAPAVLSALQPLLQAPRPIQF